MRRKDAPACANVLGCSSDLSWVGRERAYAAGMSINVPLAELAQTIENRPFAYLLTVSEGARVHAVAVDAVVEGDRLLVPQLGRRTLTNSEARTSVTLLWPPTQTGGYSLIVDGTAERLGDGVLVRPVRAVLHRPADRTLEASGDACGSDCVDLPTD